MLQMLFHRISAQNQTNAQRRRTRSDTFMAVLLPSNSKRAPIFFKGQIKERAPGTGAVLWVFTCHRFVEFVFNRMISRRRVFDQVLESETRPAARRADQLTTGTLIVKHLCGESHIYSFVCHCSA